jgi:hypothetical protein
VPPRVSVMTWEANRAAKRMKGFSFIIVGPSAPL